MRGLDKEVRKLGTTCNEVDEKVVVMVVVVFVEVFKGQGCTSLHICHLTSD